MHARARDAGITNSEYIRAGENNYVRQPASTFSRSEVASGDSDQQIYREALLRVQQPDHDYRAVKAILIVLKATSKLYPRCNISAERVTKDACSFTVFEQWETRPERAGHLVMEITESARIPATGAAIAFVRHLQKLGRRVVVDDFGVGLTTLHFINDVQPDIIKMDRKYPEPGRERNAAHEVFHNLSGRAPRLRKMSWSKAWKPMKAFRRPDVAATVGCKAGFIGRLTLLPAWHAAASCVLASAVRPSSFFSDARR